MLVQTCYRHVADKCCGEVQSNRNLLHPYGDACKCVCVCVCVSVSVSLWGVRVPLEFLTVAKQTGHLTSPIISPHIDVLVTPHALQSSDAPKQQRQMCTCYCSCCLRTDGICIVVLQKPCREAVTETARDRGSYFFNNQSSTETNTWQCKV